MVYRPSEIAASVALVVLGKHDSSVLESVATNWKQLRKVFHIHPCNPETQYDLLDYQN
jgi:hypothetical protein